MIDAIAAVGDAGDINCWSGIPWYFGRAVRRQHGPASPWRLDLAGFEGARRRWNLIQWLCGQGFGGYQYSPEFLAKAEEAVPAALWAGTVLSFNQHYPRAESVRQRGSRLVQYIDATFYSLSHQESWYSRLPAGIRATAIETERANYHGAARVVTMARWTAQSVIRDCGVPAERVATILPGANVELPPDFSFAAPSGRPGSERPLVLGFVGKDWQRKGLPFLLEVRGQLERRGVKAVVRAAGNCPPALRGQAGLEYGGFIDKAREPARFVEFLAGCDLGCLFSMHEPLGISTLEFLRVGVPVTGFAVEGLADTLPPDAGFRFAPGTAAGQVADVLMRTFSDEARIAALRSAAHIWSSLVTWERCVKEWHQLLVQGRIADPVQPWKGLPLTIEDALVP